MTVAVAAAATTTSREVDKPKGRRVEERDADELTRRVVEELGAVARLDVCLVWQVVQSYSGIKKTGIWGV